MGYAAAIIAWRQKQKLFRHRTFKFSSTIYRWVNFREDFSVSWNVLWAEQHHMFGSTGQSRGIDMLWHEGKFDMSLFLDNIRKF